MSEHAGRPAASKSAATVRHEIVAMRRQMALSQRDVGLRLGRAQSVISRWERGVLAPTIPDLVVLSGLLGQPLEIVAVAFRGPGRERSRRGDSVAVRQQVGWLLRSARLDADLDPWTVARRARITPRRLRRLEAGAQASGQEFVALIGVLPALAVAVENAGLDTIGDPPTVPPGPNQPGASTPD